MKHIIPTLSLVIIALFVAGCASKPKHSGSGRHMQEEPVQTWGK